MKKEQSQMLTAAVIRITMKTSDRELIERAARQDGRGEISDWCRRVLVPAAKKALGEGETAPRIYHHALPDGRIGCGAEVPARGHTMPELNHVTCEACLRAFRAVRDGVD